MYIKLTFVYLNTRTLNILFSFGSYRQGTFISSKSFCKHPKNFPIKTCIIYV